MYMYIVRLDDVKNIMLYQEASYSNEAILDGKEQDSDTDGWTM